MELALYILAIVIIGVNCDYLTDKVAGCSSKCAVTTDEDLTCFNTTLEYYEKTLFGIMRNYVAAQLNLAARSANRVPPSKDQMISATLAVMDKVRPLNIEDEKGLLTVEDARPIVKALVENVMANTPGMYETSCPEGCQRSRSPWIWWFAASASANVILAIMVLAFTVQSHLKVKKMLRDVPKLATSSTKIAKQK
ncbi:hypothetical protein Aduo_017954 [Ancylostoma duodenale]